MRAEKDPERIPALLKHKRWDVILLDMNFAPGVSSGAYLYRVIIEAQSDRFMESGRMTVVK